LAGECFPEGAVQRVELLQYGDHPRVEPGELVVQVLIPAGDAGGPEDADATSDAGDPADAGGSADAGGAGGAGGPASAGPSAAVGGRANAGRSAGFDRDPFDVFKHTHFRALERFRDAISRELPGVSFIELTVDGGPEHKGLMRMRLGPSSAERPGDLTPVMARLGPTDLQTLDTLITTGIAANRADAVRWTLARIRERPAYAELRDRARQIEELKTQF
jgi:hypothetical protein